MLFPARDLAAVRAFEPRVHALVPIDALDRRELWAAVLLRADRVLRRLEEGVVEIVQPLARLLSVGERSSRRVAAQRPNLGVACAPAAEPECPADPACRSRVLPGDDPKIRDRIGRVGRPAVAATAPGQGRREGQNEH